MWSVLQHRRPTRARGEPASGRRVVVEFDVAAQARPWYMGPPRCEQGCSKRQHASRAGWPSRGHVDGWACGRPCGSIAGRVRRQRRRCGPSGGGGAARSIAQAWVEAGGRVLPVPGRRALSGLPEDAVATHGAAFGVDVDGGEGLLDAPCVLYPAYRVGDAPRGGGRLASSEIDGRWMLAAQHLEAWSRCWAPDVAPFLPDVPRLVEDLLALEARLGADARDA